MHQNSNTLSYFSIDLWHDAKTRELNTLLLQLSKDPQFGKTPISWEAITDTLNLNVKSKSKIQVEEVKFRGGGLFSGWLFSFLF